MPHARPPKKRNVAAIAAAVAGLTEARTTDREERDDALDPRRFAHDRFVTEERPVTDPDGAVTGRTTGLKVVTQTPLDRYLAHGHISPEQWWGGDRLREDFERSAFDTTARARYDGMPGGGLHDITQVTVAACEARRRYIAAIRALPMRLSPVVVHVCCLRQYAADWAVSKRLPKADGMALLRLGLDILADHYGGARRRRSRQPEPAEA